VQPFTPVPTRTCLLPMASASRSTRGASSKRWELKDPASQILDLDDAEVLDTMVWSWYRDAAYEDMIDSFKLAELRRVLPKMGLQVVEGHGAIERMRALAKAAVKEHGDQHPELFDDAADGADARSDDGDDNKSAGAADADAAAKSLSDADLPQPMDVDRAPPSRRRAEQAPVSAQRQRRLQHAVTPPKPVRASVLAALGSLPMVSPDAREQRARIGARLVAEPSDEEDDRPARKRTAKRRSTPLSSSSSSPDSSSDGEQPSRSYGHLRRADLDSELVSAGAMQPFAKEYIRNAGGKGNLYRVFKYDVHFDKERNQRECLSLARIIDEALCSGVRTSALFIELACRRLAGVHAADYSGGNWALCDDLEMYKDKQSFLPARVLQRTVKNVIRLEALKKSGSHNAAGDKAGKNSRGRVPPGPQRQRGSAAGADHGAGPTAPPKKGAGAGSSTKK
jgi:hypothetical protein